MLGSAAKSSKGLYIAIDEVQDAPIDDMHAIASAVQLLIRGESRYALFWQFRSGYIGRWLLLQPHVYQSKPKEAFAGWLWLIHSSVNLTSELSVGYMEFVQFYQAQSDSRDLGTQMGTGL